MHELSITESIMNIALTHAQKAEAKKITDVYVVMGQLSSLVDDSVQFYWDIITENTICEGAILHFERIPAKLICIDCNNSYTLSGPLTPCPECGSSRVQVISGEEFWLNSIEIEK